MKKNTHPFHDLKGERRDQLLITCDQHGKPNGFATRKMCHQADGKTHLAFMAFVYDEKGNVWMTKRGKQKSLWAGFWDASTISHVLPGESTERAAERRGKEELGIEVNFRKVGSFYYFAKFNGDCENEFCYVLVGKTMDVPHPNPVEIEDIKKIPARSLVSEVINQTSIYTPWLRFAIRKVVLPEKV
ncbi:NUDIX domain-containing protein [Candidatus Gottesmanbacteria bacterium]|nr:NUDIX domain-containing protein [Candidatus Gottesmanbacteria bacterium]